MVRIPDFEAEAWAAIRRGEQAVTSIWDHYQAPVGEHPYPAAETPATPGITPATPATTQEDDMSLSADIHAFANRVEKFDEDVLNDVEAIQANPVTARVFATLRTLTGIDASPILDAAAGLLEAVPQHAAAPAEMPAAAPATAAPIA